MGKTQYQRQADNNWKRMWAAEVKRNALHKANKGLNQSCKHIQPSKSKEEPKKVNWGHYDPNAHTSYHKPEKMNPNNIWDGESIPW